MPFHGSLSNSSGLAWTVRGHSRKFAGKQCASSSFVSVDTLVDLLFMVELWSSTQQERRRSGGVLSKASTPPP